MPSALTAAPGCTTRQSRRPCWRSAPAWSPSSCRPGRRPPARARCTAAAAAVMGGLDMASGGGRDPPASMAAARWRSACMCGGAAAAHCISGSARLPSTQLGAGTHLLGLGLLGLLLLLRLGGGGGSGSGAAVHAQRRHLLGRRGHGCCWRCAAGVSGRLQGDGEGRRRPGRVGRRGGAPSPAARLLTGCIAHRHSPLNAPTRCRCARCARADSPAPVARPELACCSRLARAIAGNGLQCRSPASLTASGGLAWSACCAAIASSWRSPR